MNIPNLNYIEDELDFETQNPYRYPTEFEIRDAFKTIKQMGGKVVRMYTLPVFRKDEPNNPTFITGPGEFVEEAFVINDLMLKIANEEGVRVVFSLLNNWKWMGGAPQYADFRRKTFEDFWVDEQLISDYKKTIEYTLNRKNTLTGIRYKDDKSILCWETGNELNSPYSWVKEIAAYLKQLDNNHLVMDGYYAMDNFRYVHQESVEDPNVDILSSHHYEQDPYSQIENIESNLSIIKGRKPYILGELGFESTSAHRHVYDYIIANKEIAGTFNWSIRSHREEGGFYWHSEPVGHNLYKAYHWPGFDSGNDYDEKGLLQLMREKAYEISGLDVPELPIPQAPTLLPINYVYEISWQGSVGASGYNIERSESKNGLWETIAHNVSDAAVQYVPIFNDTSVEIGQSYYYRVEALNTSGISSKSNVIGPIKVGEKAIIDEMGNLMTVFGYKDVTVNKGLDRKFKEDTERILGELGAELSYVVPGNIDGIKVYAYEQNDLDGLEFFVSKDGETFTSMPIDAIKQSKGGGDYDYWNPVLYKSDDLTPGYNYLKIKFKNKTQIGRVLISYN
ncbi:endo-beta-1,4-mannanase [Formosa agariphila KMM 3901]|uniref:mannan endo-1,4-beta-mannosidase n=2 Tax=Formosa TaxID=225842 RepID=T2KQU5_FORAG|nr:endo-beta-1,4-mannanase [Formosa agariphila KMM 3901]